MFYFELGGITKHLMTVPSGNSEFCFPSTLNVLGVSGKQNSLSLGVSHYCLPNDDLWFGLSSFRNWVSVKLEQSLWHKLTQNHKINKKKISLLSSPQLRFIEKWIKHDDKEKTSIFKISTMCLQSYAHMKRFGSSLVF